MNKTENHGTIGTNDVWFRCPYCGRKIIRLLPDTRAVNLVLYCRLCKQEIIANIPNESAP